MLKKMELWYPLDFWFVTQKFGECAPSVCDLYKSLGLKGHNGFDLACQEGTPVRASHDGTIVFAGEDATSGYTISLRTDDKRQYGLDGAYFKSIYCHLKKGSFRFAAGDKVKVGEVMALSGKTGKVTGPHLHFGLKPVYKGENDWTLANAEQHNGYYGAIDCGPYFNGFFAKDAQTVISKYQAIIQLLANFLKGK